MQNVTTLRKPKIFPNAKRLELQKKLRELRSQDSDLHRKLLSSGVDPVALKQYSEKVPRVAHRAFGQEELERRMTELFALGGVMSGGAALAAHTGGPFWDADFCFNQDEAFVRAKIMTQDCPFLDVHYYTNEPWELYDLAITMCKVDGNGKVTLAEACERTLDTKVCDIFLESIYYPKKTVSRLFKYNHRYGVKYPRDQVMALCRQYGMPEAKILRLEGIITPSF